MTRGAGGAGSPKRKTVLTVAMVYVLVLAIGCLIIWAIPLLKNKTDLLEIAESKGDQVLSAGLEEEVMIFGMDYALYNEDSVLIYRVNDFLYASQWENVKDYAPQVIEKGQVFAPAILLLDNRDEPPTYIFGVIVGVVVTSASGKQFASILIRDFTDVDTTMLTYMILFTFLYVIGLIFMFHTIRKERELNRMRRDLIANVSHELKTPITAIRAMAEVLHDGMVKDAETRKTYSGKIMEESDHLEQLVLDMLELSKLQSRRAEFRKVQVYADGVIPPVIDRYMMLCCDMGITLDTGGMDLAAIPPLYTDPDHLVTLMTILLDNAVKFTGKGGCVWVSSQVHGRSATFCIRDNGPGVRREDLDRIFERFYKSDVAHNSTGSGLGLAIADEIAKGLGEKLWVESKYGEGAAFYFTVGF